jgi:hypothetical protein
MIQPIGNSPKHAPCTAAATAASAGMPHTPMAIASAETSPAMAARIPDQRAKASRPSRTTSGTLVASVERIGDPSGS